MTSRIRWAALAYLAGSTFSLLHPLEDLERTPCLECDAGDAPAFVASCSGGNDCPAGEHHHHPSRSPAHDAARCGICQKQAPGATPDVHAPLVASGVAGPSGCVGDSVHHGTSSPLRPPTRAPPTSAGSA